MDPLFMARLAIMLGRKRTYPECKRTQIVPAKKRRGKVSCKFCGADIPPKNIPFSLLGKIGILGGERI